MTRKRARIGLVICFVLWFGASQEAGSRPVDFYHEPVTAFLVYFGPLIALVLLILSFVGRKEATRTRRGSEHDPKEGGSEDDTEEGSEQ
ncbi:hypothetical protein ACH35V_21470 [Actinomadura sp. 1N219]|uniref:hypothetical protein n=1 Tax=Actinomadura sp. 1N219 TaxID=3375152 RepID=UPI0037943449